jgi:hypothetical protein
VCAFLDLGECRGQITELRSRGHDATVGRGVEARKLAMAAVSTSTGPLPDRPKAIRLPSGEVAICAPEEGLHHSSSGSCRRPWMLVAGAAQSTYAASVCTSLLDPHQRGPCLPPAWPRSCGGGSGRTTPEAAQPRDPPPHWRGRNANTDQATPAHATVGGSTVEKHPCARLAYGSAFREYGADGLRPGSEIASVCVHLGSGGHENGR